MSWMAALTALRPSRAAAAFQICRTYGGVPLLAPRVRRLRSNVNHRRCSRGYRAALATGRRYYRLAPLRRTPREGCRVAECAETRVAHRGSTEAANGRNRPCV